MYDGFRRMNAVLTQSDYDGQMPVYEQQTSGGNPVWKRWNALGARGIDAYYNSTSSSWLYPLYDVHGNVKATLTRSGATGYSTANWKSYDVWGGERASTGSGSMFGYCGNLGHPTDPENGLIYMRARFYEPWTGRFLNQDPAFDGKNWYVYCANAPTSYVDATGQYYNETVVGYVFRMESHGGFPHLHIRRVGERGDLYTVQMNGDAWHGNKTSFPDEVIEALVKGASRGDRKANNMIRKLLIGGYGLSDDAIRQLGAAYRPKGAGLAVDSLTATMINDPVLFVEIMRTIAGQD